MCTPKSEVEPSHALFGSEREELYVHRIQKAVVGRIHSEFAIVGVAVTILAILGFLGFAKYLEYTLSDSISRKIDQQLTGIQANVEDARKKTEGTKLETELLLRSTVDRVSYMGQLLVDDVERRRHEIASELIKESQRFEAARKETESRSRETLDGIRAELVNLERLTSIVRAPLREKIQILSGLNLERSAQDADKQRYIAILVLKEMEDAELVKREKAEREAGKILSELFAKQSMRDEFFAEVRLRVIRAVGELGLVDTAIQQVSDPSSWERGSLVLLLGALSDPKAIPILAKVARNSAESVDLREKAIRSLTVFRQPQKRPLRWLVLEKVFKEWPWGHPGWKYADPQIEAMLPRHKREVSFRVNVTEEQTLLAVEAISSVLADKKEPDPLRRASLTALRYFGEPKVVGLVKRVLLDEWTNYGELAIDVLEDIPSEPSVAALGEFVLRAQANQPLRLRAVNALADIEIRPAMAALKEISERDPDEKIRVAALEAAKVLAKKIRSQ